MKKQLRILIIGDHLNGGKTKFLRKFINPINDSSVANNDFIPVKDIKLQSTEITLQVWDATEQQHYNKMRPLSYANAHLIMMFFDTSHPSSFNNITTKWYPELSQYYCEVPLVLVGLDNVSNRKVTNKAAQELAKRLNVLKYFECDLATANATDVKTIFKESIAPLLNIPMKPVPVFFKNFKKKKIYPHVQKVMELGKASRQNGHAFYDLPVEVLTHICDYLGNDITTDKKSLHHFNRLLLGNVKNSEPKKLVWNRYLLLGDNSKLSIYPEPDKKSVLAKFCDGTEEVFNKIKNFL